MPKNLKKLCSLGKARWLTILMWICILLALFTALCAACSYAMPDEAIPCSAQEDRGVGEYLSIRPDYASKTVYTDEDADISYYVLFWWDIRGHINARIVCGDRDLDVAMTDLQYYTYGTTDELPDRQLVVRGVAVPMPDAVKESAVAAYNELLEDPMEADDFDTVFGTYCLDTGKVPIYWDIMAFFIAVTVVILSAAFYLYRKARAIRRRCAGLTQRFSAQVLQHAAEQLPGARAFPACGMYLSQDYLYIHSDGLQLIPRHTVSRVRIGTGKEPYAEKAGRGSIGRIALQLQTTVGNVREPWLRRTAAADEQMRQVAYSLLDSATCLWLDTPWDPAETDKTYMQ